MRELSMSGEQGEEEKASEFRDLYRRLHGGPAADAEK